MFRKLLVLLLGFAVGAAIGAALVTIFAPEASEQLRRGFNETLAEARRASRQRQAELEAQLIARQRRPISGR